jgi:hypothetical protein
MSTEETRFECGQEGLIEPGEVDGSDTNASTLKVGRKRHSISIPLNTVVREVCLAVLKDCGVEPYEVEHRPLIHA